MGALEDYINFDTVYDSAGTRKRLACFEKVTQKD